jgi:signal transduction histidine kinase/ligand-binding sensor domain-containing protein/DNA-binding NarL/FixJ family response regulator
VKPCFPRLWGLPLLALTVLSPAVGQRAASTAASGGPQPGSELSAARNIPGSLQSRFRFEHLTSADGLSNDSVFSILQDHRGFMWFGTQGGLNRYDGYRVTQYRHDPKDSHSLGDDFVQQLFEDSRGGIWSGTSVLSRFDPATETFTRYPLPSDGRVLITGFAEDHHGVVWVASTIERLLRFEPGTPASRGYDLGKLIPRAKDGFQAIHSDADGILWLGTTDGLVRFDPATGDRIHYSPNPPASIRGIASNQSGKLWLATPEGAQNVFDPVTRKFARNLSIAAHPDDSGGGMTASIYVDPSGTVWRGTWTEGLNIFYPYNGMMGTLRYDPADPHSLSGNQVLSIVRDREGSVWVGVKGGGVNRLPASSTTFGNWRHDPGNPDSPGDNNVRAIYGDRNGGVWIGTYNGGLDQFEPMSGKFVHYRHDPNNPRSLDSDRVYSIYQDRSGTLWAGTAVGINRLDRKSGLFERFSRDSIVPQGSAQPLYSFLEDRAGRFWFGIGGFGGWTALLDRSTGATTVVEHEGGLSMLEDRSGNLWLDSNVGLEKVDSGGKVHKVPVSLSSSAGGPEPVQVNYLHEDSEGILWLATETGLVRLDPKTEKYTTYTTREGLPDNVVQCILPDQSGNLWVSTNNGLSIFNPRESAFKNYHESDGLQGEQFNRKACFEDSTGRMYFGGLHGFNVFDPRQIMARPMAPPPLVLTEFQIDGKTVPVRPGSLLPRPIWDMDAIQLSYRENGVSFEFAALNYRDPARTRYRFRLDNLEKGWTEVDSRHRYARYTDLGPGEYTFYVQASDDGKTWNGKGTALGLSIEPPWWATWWFRSIAVLTIAAVVFVTYQSRIRSMRLAGVRLEAQVAERTRELEIAKEAAERASRAKGTFLATMSHELRTPLNSILGFSALVRDDPGLSEKHRKDLDIVSRSGKHLLGLIDDVLDTAKIEAGRITLDHVSVDLDNLVRDNIAMLRARASEKGLELFLSSSPSVPRFVRSDAGKLRQVLVNLIGNAIKYTDRGSVTVRLDAKPMDADPINVKAMADGRGILLIFEVEDTGIGIASEDQTRVFDAYVQAGQAYAQKGTGLGLSITQQFVNMMGGTIRVQSATGKGSLFRVELPVEQAEESEMVAPNDDDGQVMGLAPGEPEYRILLVEDKKENWLLLQRLLADAGFQVQVAEDGAQGVEMFRTWQPHLIWMDIRLPVMGGLEAAREIRTLDGGRQVKIVALTASAFAQQRDEVLAAGLDDFLRKPYRREEIFECMARHLGIRYLYREKSRMSPADSVAALRSEALATLSQQLRKELADALVRLDAGPIAEVIDRVSQQDAQLGEVLAHFAKRFAYTEVLNALRNTNGMGGKALDR